MYFEYAEDGTPLGFVLNDTQYLYITNNSADVMAIADSTGNVIATYSYNEWGEVTVNASGTYDQEKLLGDIQKTNKYEKLESIIITCWYLFKMYIFESIPLILAFFVVKRKYGIYIASYMVVAILLITFLVVSLI